MFTAAFLAALVATLALSVSQWSPATVVVNATPVPAASIAQVRALVKASTQIEHVPADLNPPVSVAVQGPRSNFGGPPASCFLEPEQTVSPACVFGDISAPRTVVLYGDSYASMWFAALNAIAKRDRWKLVILSKGGCPASQVAVYLLLSTHDFTQCDVWHTEEMKRIQALDPDLLVVSQDITRAPDSAYYSPAQWRKALARTLDKLPAKRKVVVGTIPFTLGPPCLAAHEAHVQVCSQSPSRLFGPYNRAEHQAAIDTRASYVSVTPWFCSTRCSPVIGNFDVYFDKGHVAIGYSEYLEGVLGNTLGM